MRTGGRNWQLRKKKDDQPLCWLKAGNALQNVLDSSLPEARDARNVSGFIMDRSWFSLCLSWKLCCRNPRELQPWPEQWPRQLSPVPLLHSVSLTSSATEN